MLPLAPPLIAPLAPPLHRFARSPAHRSLPLSIASPAARLRDSVPPLLRRSSRVWGGVGVKNNNAT